MKLLNKAYEFFIKNVVLIFIMLVVMPSFINVHDVHASDFKDWSFEIVDKTGSNSTEDVSQFHIEIKDSPSKNWLSKDKSKGDVWNELMNRYKVFIVGIMGFAVLTMVVIAMILFTKLSATASNPQERQHTIKWIGIFLVAAGLLGSVSIVFSYSYGIFSKG